MYDLFLCPELTINGVSCLQSLEYHSSRKLVCLRPNAPGTGDIIVNTFSGGSGTCTVRITIQQPEVKQLLGKLGAKSQSPLH